MARNVFDIGEVWNPVCCHGNKTFKLILCSTFSRISLERIKHFCYKLAEISFFIISDQNLVEYMTSSPGQFAYFKNLNISWNEKRYLKKVNGIFLLT